MKHIIGFFMLLGISGLMRAEGLPDILVFLTDDLSVRDVSSYGAPDVRTPNIDRLARAGLRFDRAFIASPACAPSRAALLTGLMPARNGAEANHTYPKDGIEGLIGGFQTLGYQVASFGKIAHGGEERWKRWGFDHAERKYDLKTVSDWLRQNDSTKPMCLFVGSRDPHVPWKEDVSKSPKEVVLPPFLVDTPVTHHYRRQYYADVIQCDTDFGVICDLFKKSYGENSLVVFSSDHGAQWPFGKWTLYDEGIRVPLIFSWPGKIENSSVSQAMVSWIDVIPTLIDCAGGTVPKELDGKSFRGVLLGETSVHRDRIFTTHTGDGTQNIYPIRSVRSEEWKFIWNMHPNWLFTSHSDNLRKENAGAYWNSWAEKAVVDPEAALIVQRYFMRPSEELYNLSNDPDELRNLAADPRYVQLLIELRRELTEWMESQGDDVFVHAQPRYPDEQSDLLEKVRRMAERARRQ